MGAVTISNGGDLPELLDMLTVAVTTLDAVGVDSFRDLYLYVVGMNGGHAVRDLRMEDGHLVVGPPSAQVAFPAYLEQEFEANRRALLLADLCYIMRIWDWRPATMSAYLRCSEAMLSKWIGRSSAIDIPIVPRAIGDRIRRLSMIEQMRFLVHVADSDMPAWLCRRRPGFGQKSIEEMLIAGGPSDFAQVLLWGLNSAPTPTLH